MIKVIVGTTGPNGTSKQSIFIDENATLRQALENAGIDCSAGAIYLDFVYLPIGEIDKTFADYGISEKCCLFQSIKYESIAWEDFLFPDKFAIL